MDSENQTVQGHSGWLVPLAIFILTAILSGILLLYYLAPRPRSLIEEHAAPTTSTARVSLMLGEVNFSIPANYLRYKNARKGGILREAALFAILPDFRGYSDGAADKFLGNAADSPVIEILLHDEPTKLGEAERLARIYLEYVSDPKGKQGPFGLTAYDFRDGTGYADEDLFVGRLAGHLVVLRCDRLGPHNPSPSCSRDTRLARHAGLTYRFKRAQLSRWREIATGVDSLMHSFMRGN
jgi:hypothetical protein